MIFVFGSNLAGHHGAGAARAAIEEHGAIMGRGVGLQGQSYAIPTMDAALRPLDLQQIRFHVEAFLDVARAHPELEFRVTRIGCGIAGFADIEIAPFFVDAPQNCLFDAEWAEELPDHRYWGTHP